MRKLTVLTTALALGLSGTALQAQVVGDVTGGVAGDVDAAVGQPGDPLGSNDPLGDVANDTFDTTTDSVDDTLDSTTDSVDDTLDSTTETVDGADAGVGADVSAGLDNDGADVSADTDADVEAGSE